MKLPIHSEILRKVIHISCAFFPMIYLLWLSKEQIVILCGLITCGFFVAEIVRFKSVTGEKIFNYLFKSLLREKEKSTSLTGATWLFMAITITFWLFSKKIAVASIFVVTIADSLAAIIGKRYGRKKMFDKSWLGSSVFLISTTVILLILFPLLGYKALLFAVPIAFLEALSLPVNDNILIPIFAGALLTVGHSFTG